MSGKKQEKRFTAVSRKSDNRFLNFYEMDALTEGGTPFSYYFTSRCKEEDLPALTGKTILNGIVIYPIWKESPDKVVLLKQYRYPIGRWIYEFPAGLLEENETAEQGAIREMKEETGLEFEPYTGGNAAFRRPVFMGAGFTDETSSSVFGYAQGEISGKYKEETESIEVILADAVEAERILREEQVSLRCSLLLMQFLQMEKEAPFRFLDTGEAHNRQKDK